MRSRPARLLAPAALALPLLAGTYLDGPPPAHTGGFGEPTCAVCHAHAPADAAAARLELEGLPEAWVAGKTYELEVVLRSASLPAGGFQLSARFAGGGTPGEQAGAVAAGSDRVAVVDSAGVRYAQHAAGGTAPTARGEARWGVRWTAPATGDGPVAFHVAANAANDDASEFGDRVVTIERRVGQCAE